MGVGNSTAGHDRPIRAPRIAFGVVALFLVLFAGLLLLISTQAGGFVRSGTVSVSTNACFAGFDEPRPVEAVMADPGAFNCRSGIAEKIDGRQFWVRIDRSRFPLRGDRLNLEVDSTPAQGWTVAYRDGQGAVHSRTLTTRDVYRNWTAGTRASIPLDLQESRAAIVYVGVSDPWSRASFNAIHMTTRDRADRDRMVRMIPFAIFAGIALVPILYSSMLFLAVRYRFMLYHALSAACLLAYTVSSSSLLLFFVPETGPWVRTLLSYGSLAVGIGFACYFSVEFIERQCMTDMVARITRFCGHLMFANALFIVTLGPSLPFLARYIYHAVYLFPIAGLVILLVSTIRRGSTAAWFVLGGWLLTSLSAGERILRGLDIYVLPPEADFSLYVGFAFEVMVSACGVALRMFALRRDRDIARSQERVMQKKAETDGLTGLGNRHRFDRDVAGLTRGALILVDLDHFKAINDTHGHQAGDDALHALGRLMAGCESPPWNATAYRVGGEEFALLLPMAQPAQAAAFAERLRRLIERDLASAIPQARQSITASIGVAMSDPALSEDAYARADRALYRSKNEGRNRVTVAGPNDTAPITRTDRRRLARI